MVQKHKIPPLEELLERPWCYYCERDFDDLKVLQDHQRAKHFKCHRCNRRLNTINGLKVHTEQVHKASITEVDNCTIPNRNTIDREIYGMEGIPTDVMDAHKQHLTTEYFKRVGEWKEKTGNPISGENPNKRQREFDTDPGAFKARLEEHKRKKRAEKAAREAGLNPSATAPGTNTMQTLTTSPAPPHDPTIQSVADQSNGNVPYGQNHGAGAVGGANFVPDRVHFGPPAPPGAAPNFMPMSMYPVEHAIPASSYNGGSPLHQQPLPHAVPAASAPGHPYGGANGSSPPAWSPPTFFPPSVPPPSGSAALPSRPNFLPPNISREDMVKMHAGKPFDTNGADQHAGVGSYPQPQIQASDVDDLINEVRADLRAASANPGQVQTSTPTAVPDVPSNGTSFNNPTAPVETSEAKQGPDPKRPHKSKDQASSKVVWAWSDKEISPEEKRSKFKKYSNINPVHNTQTMLGHGVDAVTGTVDDGIGGPAQSTEP